MEPYLLTLVIFFPAVGAVLLFVLPRESHENIRRAAFGIALLEFIFALPLFFRFDAVEPGMQFLERYDWISAFRIQYLVGIDGLSLFLILLTALLTPLAVLASWSITSRVREFFAILLVLETGMIGVFAALDLFLFYVFWEVMLIPMYFLIGVWGHERRIYASIKFILYTMLGSLLMLVAILWIYTISGTFSLLELFQLRSGPFVLFGAGEERWLFLAFFLAFAIKVPLFPFHTWLPDAHVEAPTAGSIVLAGVLLKMGAYGLLRFCLPLFPDAVHEFAPAISALAIIGILYTALVAWVQPDMKKLIAYSSVAHMGFVVLGIMAMNTLSLEGAMFQMLNHGVTTAMLFALAGMLYDRRHTHKIADFGGIATPMPLFATFFLLACLSSLGLPPLNNFVGEFLILLGVFHAHPVYAALAALGVILAALYLLWMVQRVAYGEITHEANRTLPDLTRRELAIVLPLAFLIIWMGMASPVFTRRMETTANQILLQANAPQYERAQKPAANTIALSGARP